MRQRISKRTVDALKPGQSIADLEIPGFTARCLPSGAISYDFRYRTPTSRERRRLSLGLHGAITPDQARARAEKRLDELAKEVDPAAARQRQRAATVNALLDNYVERVLGKKRSKPAQVSAFDRLIRPQIGDRSIYDLNRSDIAELFDGIEDASGPVMADRTLAYLRAAFSWQQLRDDKFISPIIKGMARTKPKERARSRILSDDELRAIWKATEGQGAFHALIRFLLLTGARRTEASAMSWTEIDGTDWTLPAARNKTKVDLVRPLSKAVQEIIPSRASHYVFSTDGGKTPISGFSKFKAGLDKQSGVTGWTPHDLRRTARSLMSRAAVPSDHAERCLGHVIGGVRGTYDRHEYHKEKAEAYEKLAKQVAAIVKGR
jgi:integrase